MPFTPAHIAAVLPGVRSRYLSATGLVVGSMAPDFEYFFKMSVDGIHGHTWAGLLYFDLPVSVGLAWLFHRIVKRNLITNLPWWLQQRFIDTLQTDFVAVMRNRPLTFLFSAALGSATHIIWDGFTHGSGFFVKYFSFYNGAYVPFDGVRYPLWYSLQHMSTAIGLAAVVIYIFCKRKSNVLNKPRILYWIVFALIGLSAVLLRFLLRLNDLNAGNFVVSSITGICIALIGCGLVRFNSESD
jgi:hypothetical protein